MNFIHDITLNFNEELYEYYEWEKHDKLITVKKIPIFKVSKKDYYEIKNEIITFNHDFIDKITKQSQIFSNNNKYKYIFLVAFDEEVIAVNLNNHGKIIKRSHLTLDEENDILRYIKKINISKISFIKEIKSKSNPYLTRYEKEKIKIIMNKLYKLYTKNEYNKLSYLYLECFNKKENNIDIIYSRLKNELTNTEILNKISDFLILLKQK